MYNNNMFWTLFIILIYFKYRTRNISWDLFIIVLKTRKSNSKPNASLYTVFEW